MMEIGQVCVKVAGRDARKTCVIIDVLDDVYVLIDGQTRRRKCNILHLEPLNQVLDVKKNADHASIVAVLKTINVVVDEKKGSPSSEKKPRPVRKKAVKKKIAPKEKKEIIKEAKVVKEEKKHGETKTEKEAVKA